MRILKSEMGLKVFWWWRWQWQWFWVWLSPLRWLIGWLSLSRPGNCPGGDGLLRKPRWPRPSACGWQQTRIRCSNESQAPELARPCSRHSKMTGRWMEKLHGTTESQVMILKLFPSLLLCHSSQMLQDRITLAFQVMQMLISPKIVFWPFTMLLLSQLPFGIPVVPGIR